MAPSGPLRFVVAGAVVVALTALAVIVLQSRGSARSDDPGAVARHAVVDASRAQVVPVDAGAADAAPIPIDAYSDVGPQAVSGTGNINVDPQFVDAASRNVHLMTASPAKDVADSAATLAVDIDGDLRPQGTARDMGADEVVP